MRKIIALTAAAGLLVTLAACSTGAPSGDCTPTASSGDASSLVTATGDFAAAPHAEFPTPLIASDIEVSTIDAGTGDVIYPGQYAAFQATAYDAATGDIIIASAYDTSKLLNRAGAAATKVGLLFECQTVGSRVVEVMKASDLYGFYNVTDQTTGLGDPDATIVFVADIQDSILGKAYGVEQIPQQGMPSVVTAPDGQPGVTVPAQDPPTTLKTAVLKQGDGATVAAGDAIYTHYLRLDWSDPKSTTSMKSTWTDFGIPEVMTMTALDASSGVGVTAGVLQSLVGQKIGSQVLVVVPPSFGFPDGSAPDGVDSTSTLVYVIDILGVVK